MRSRYEMNKASIMRWRSKNAERYRMANAQYQRSRYEWVRISKVFRCILLDSLPPK